MWVLVALFARDAFATDTPDIREIEELSLLSLIDPNKTTLASRKEESEALAPAVITVITAHDIELRGIRTISEALQRVPGFYPSRQFFHDDVLGVRGYFYHTNDKVVLLIDGHNVSNSGWTGPMTGDLDEVMGIDKVEAIEVIRGPGSLMWGDNAILTVINIKTRDPADVEGLTARLTGGVHTGAEPTWDTALSLMYAKSAGIADLLVSLHVPRVQGWITHDYPDWFKKEIYPTAQIDNFDTRYQSFELFGKARIEESTAWFRAMNAHQNSAQFQSPLGSSQFEDQLDYSPQVYSMGVDHEAEFGDSTELRGQLQFDKYHFTGRGFSFPGQAIEDDPYALMNMTQDQNTLGASAHLNTVAIPRHDLIVGGGYVYQQNESSRISFISPDGLSKNNAEAGDDVVDVWEPGIDHTLNGYVQDSWDVVGPVRVVAGVRAEWNVPRGMGRVVFAPRAAAILHSADDRVVLKYMFNTGYRRPNFWQSQWPDGLFGTERAATRPEYASNHDVQLIATVADRVLLDLVVFRQDVHGIILSTLTADGSRKTWKNVGTFSSDGVEASVDTVLNRSSAVGANLTWTRTAQVREIDPGVIDTLNNSAGRYLDYPELQATVHSDFERDLGAGKLLANAALRYATGIPGLEYQDAATGYQTYLRDAQGDVVYREVNVRDVFYLDANVAFQDFLREGTHLGVRALNLLDARPRIPVSTDHGLYEGPPRYVELQLGLRF